MSSSSGTTFALLQAGFLALSIWARRRTPRASSFTRLGFAIVIVACAVSLVLGVLLGKDYLSVGNVGICVAALLFLVALIRKEQQPPR